MKVDSVRLKKYLADIVQSANELKKIIAQNSLKNSLPVSKPAGTISINLPRSLKITFNQPGNPYRNVHTTDLLAIARRPGEAGGDAEDAEIFFFFSFAVRPASFFESGEAAFHKFFTRKIYPNKPNQPLAREISKNSEAYFTGPIT
jgi:hypothetical protein